MSTYTQTRPGPVSTPAQAAAPPVESARAARIFVVNVIQRMLEVIDGKRPCEHLSPAITDEVFGQIAIALRRREEVLAHSPMRGPIARLQRLHLQMVSSSAANYFGTVERGSRTRAVAGRVELRRLEMSGRRVQTRWLLTEFGIL